MRTTLEIPDTLFRRSKAAAALAGVPLREFVAAALKSYLDRHGEAVPEKSGWRVVFGRAETEAVAEGDQVVKEEFGRGGPGAWA